MQPSGSGFAWMRERVSVLFSEPKIPQLRTICANRRSSIPFQCSSASRKFLNRDWRVTLVPWADLSVLFSEPKIPQSGSASGALYLWVGFSALQRAENSSIGTYWLEVQSGSLWVSVLFSEPKIPQFDTQRQA